MSLSKAAQHKKCFELLLKKEYAHYNELASFLGLSPLEATTIEERFHLHLHASGQSRHEYDFLSSLATQDKTEGAPFGSVWTYMDSLRSAQNIGNITRTVEALRLGPVRLGGSTFISPTDPKIEKYSMQASRYVDIQRAETMEHLPRPWIALETVVDAPSIYDIEYQEPCTLIVGNEERGVSVALLREVDQIVQIPLVGRKNSLNVSSAFAILASYVRHNIQGKK